jgi:hypothetical protein
MSDLFISFGNGLSPVDSNSTNNIDFKFYFVMIIADGILKLTINTHHLE